MKIVGYRRYLVLIVAAVLSVALYSAAQAGRDPVNTNWRGLAIKGYDPVAYFTQGAAVKGSADFTLEWQGARWWFANADHRDRFKRSHADIKTIIRFV